MPPAPHWHHNHHTTPYHTSRDPDSISQIILEQIVLFVYFLTFSIPMRICHELIKEQYKVTYLSPLQVNNAHEQIDRQEAHLFSPVFPGQVHF